MRLFVILMAGCASEHLPAHDTGRAEASLAAPPVDSDGDGYVEADDCDDQDAAVHPGREEVCDGLDNNCNGIYDEGHEDTDQDGTADCVDEEECDGLDNNGDGLIDEGYPDSDSDGVADCADGEACDGLDNDGDGLVDEGFDLDGDGTPPCGALPDCDDTDAEVFPGAAELDDQRDNDCDGLIDEHRYAAGDLIATELMVNPAAVSDPDGEWIEITNTTDEVRYLDGLRLSVGDGAHTLAPPLPLPIAPGEVLVLSASGDTAHNGGVSAAYAYDGLSMSNEGGSLSLWAGEILLDSVQWGALEGGASWSLDPWGWDADENDDSAWWCAATADWAGRDAGSPGAENEGCPSFDHDGDGFTGSGGDCDDTDASVHPGAEEVWYDGTDQDCDGAPDDDADGDGVGLSEGDCDDSDASAQPGAEEVCDGVDNDCNGSVDDDASDAEPWYADDDGDGHGDPDRETWACEALSGTAGTDDDCDDADSSVYPGAEEVCGDAVDDDCDGAAQYCEEVGYSVGGDGYDWSTSGYYRGNIFLADGDEELLRYAVYLGVPESGCDLDFSVFSASSLSGGWTEEWSSTVAASGEGWVSSGGIELEIAAGTYYSLGVGWSCTATYYADYGSFTGDEAGVGAFAGNHYDNSYSGGVPGTVGAGSFAYAQVVYISE